MGKKPKARIVRTVIFDDVAIRVTATQLKKIRKSRGFTQSQLAFESGLSLSQIARIETARINPTLSTIFAIIRAMDVLPKDFFNFELPEIDQKK